MKKRWLILVLFLVTLKLTSVSAVLETHNTSAKCLLVIDRPEVAVVNASFAIGIKYYFTNQQVREVEISFLRASKLIEKKAYDTGSTVEARYDLSENQIASYQYTLLLREQIGEDEYAESRFDLSVSVISDLIKDMRLRHEMVLVSNSKQPYFDDLSIYEPYGLRDKMNYSITQKNPTKTDCLLKGSVISFTPAQDFTGRTSCTAVGNHDNITITHIYDLLVMADKKLSVTNLTDVHLEETSEGAVVYKNITGFCSYDIKGRDRPYVYLASTSQDFNLVVDHDDLRIYNISSSFSGNGLVKIGCNDQFREFYLKINEKEFYEDEIISERSGNNELLDFGIGTLSLGLPATFYTGEKNPVTATLKIDHAELHLFKKAVLQDLAANQESEARDCCLMTFELTSSEPVLKNYLLIITFQNALPLNFTKSGDDFLIDSSAAGFVVQKNFSADFIARKADSLQGLRNDLGIIKPPLSPDAEKALETILSKALRGKSPDLKAEEQKLIKTFGMLEASKIIGSSSRVTEKGERYSTALVKIRIHPKQKLKNLVIYEYIPKLNAEGIAEISFDSAVLESNSGSFEIVEPDPIVAWHFPKLEQDLELSYELSKETNILGDTIILAETAGRQGSAYPALIIILMAILLIIIVIFMLRSRRRPLKRHKKDEGIERRIEDKLLMVEKYIEKRLSQGHKKMDVALDLIKKGWPEELVEKILKKFEK